MEENLRWIDLETWPRRRHFELFRGFDVPYFTLCADVDVTSLLRAARDRRSSFTAFLVYVLARAANEVPAFRQRIRGDGVVEHTVVHPSITVITAEELFAFCSLDYVEDASRFIPCAVDAIDRARCDPTIEDEPGRDDYLFMTAIPWVSFTSMAHPVPLSPPDSIPRIAWGRYRDDGRRLRMPLSIHAHHGLVDGLHAGRVFEAVQRLADDVEQWADGTV